MFYILVSDRKVAIPGRCSCPNGVTEDWVLTGYALSTQGWAYVGSVELWMSPVSSALPSSRLFGRQKKIAFGFFGIKLSSLTWKEVSLFGWKLEASSHSLHYEGKEHWSQICCFDIVCSVFNQPMWAFQLLEQLCVSKELRQKSTGRPLRPDGRLSTLAETTAFKG